MGIPRNLFLVRHGESEGNLLMRRLEKKEIKSFSEFNEIHESEYKLTPLGISQSKKAGTWLKKNVTISSSRNFVSSNIRAMQTAVYLNLSPSYWNIDYNLREKEEGLFFSFYLEGEDFLNYKENKKDSELHPFLYRPPQGESMADLCIRIQLFLNKMVQEEDDRENVIIVCHAYVMKAFRIILEGMSPKKIDDFLKAENFGDWGFIPNCSIIHYKTHNPYVLRKDLSYGFEWMRMIRPAGGGILEDDFSIVKKQSFNNYHLLEEVKLLLNKK